MEKKMDEWIQLSTKSERKGPKIVSLVQAKLYMINHMGLHLPFAV
jgi:hypothetical protein